MATIKLQPSGKVVLKDGKVACGCCEVGCCMYPANPLIADPPLYTYKDLPDEIDFILNLSEYHSGILTAISPAFVFSNSYTFFYEGEPFLSALGNYGSKLVTPYLIKDLERTPEEYVFALCETPLDPFSQGDFSEDPPTLRCLIESGGDLTGTDKFANTYTVSGPISGAVTRTIEENICIWRGAGLRLTNFGYQWKVNGNNKTGFQNTPVGSYAGGFTVS